MFQILTPLRPYACYSLLPLLLLLPAGTEVLDTEQLVWAVLGGERSRAHVCEGGSIAVQMCAWGGMSWAALCPACFTVRILALIVHLPCALNASPCGSRIHHHH